MKNRLKIERAALNLTQEQLAQELGISRQSVNAIEAGKGVPSIIVALKIAALCGKSVEEIFSLDKADGVAMPNQSQNTFNLQNDNIMGYPSSKLMDAIKARHSVRQYVEKPLSQEKIETLQAKIEEINTEGDLHVQLVLDEPRAFSGGLAYGKFSGVSNYFVMAGRKGNNLDERVGYYGEQLVLLAQILGLNTCWAGLTYTKIAGTYSLDDDEKVVCYIAVGYGATQGTERKHKTLTELSNICDSTPHWFNKGVEAARLAPTAVNQQKFYLEYVGNNRVIAKSGFSLVGYTQIDLGIVKLHFEIGACGTRIEWHR